MRQGQQNRRGRGRNNRKGHNPLARSFESTGPEVKIRGTPSHIAEKYMSLARDAASSGDPVLAENYLQHAEHYNRIIMAFREQNGQAGGDSMNGMGRPRPASFQDPMEMGDDYGDDEGDEFGDMQPSHSGGGMNEPQPRSYDNQGQRFDNRPQRVNQHQEHRQPRERSDRQDRGDRQDRQDRNPGPDQQRGYREDRYVQPVQAPVEPIQENGHAPQPQRPEGGQPPRRRERFAQTPQHEQPEFLRRPVRRPRRETPSVPAEGAPVLDESGQD